MGEWDASGMDDRHAEFAMLRHPAWEGAGLARSMGATTLKKTAFGDGFPQVAPLKKLEHDVRGSRAA